MFDPQSGKGVTSLLAGFVGHDTCHLIPGSPTDDVGENFVETMIWELNKIHSYNLVELEAPRQCTRAFSLGFDPRLTHWATHVLNSPPDKVAAYSGMSQSTAEVVSCRVTYSTMYFQ